MNVEMEGIYLPSNSTLRKEGASRNRIDKVTVKIKIKVVQTSYSVQNGDASWQLAATNRQFVVKSCHV